MKVDLYFILYLSKNKKACIKTSVSLLQLFVLSVLIFFKFIFKYCIVIFHHLSSIVMFLLIYRNFIIVSQQYFIIPARAPVGCRLSAVASN